ncbi:unnamed protein product [Alopecurus aequalis]
MLSKIAIMVGSFEAKQQGRIKDLTSDDDLVQANATVLEATRSILERRTESLYTIRQICMQFYLGDDSIFIGQAVGDTIATQKVSSVEFTISTKVALKNCTYNDLLTQGRQFMSFFDACPDAFGGLVRLKLENLRLGESYFSKVFSICKRLEFLRLYYCDMGILSLLEVEHPQLRTLEIIGGSFERVDLKWLPKLTLAIFSCFKSRHDPLYFGDVPLLKTVGISNLALSWHKMLKLSELLGNTAISYLQLNFKSEKIWVKPEGPKQLLPVLHKLRFVNLANISEECDLTWTMFILEGAPNLKELYITVRDHFCTMITGERRKLHAFSKEKKDKDAAWDAPASDFKHHSLAVLRIFGFQAEDKFVSYVRCVTDAAVNLRDIYLYNNPVCMKCNHMASKAPKYPRTLKQRLSVRKIISKGMRPLIGIHFPT